MKVLWLTIDRNQRVANHFDDFRDTFCRVTDTDVLFQKLYNFLPNQLHEQYKNKSRVYPLMLEDITNEYDVIVCDAMFIWMFEDWNRIKIPTFIIIEDQHAKVPKLQIDFAIKHNMGIIHRYQFNQYHTDIPKHIKKIWSPHSVNINNFKDYGLPKKYGLLQTGAIGGVYQLRSLVHDTMKGMPEYHRIVRPVDNAKQQWPVQDQYSRELNKAKICLCCGATVEYPVMKFFEIPASKSVLYTDYFNELGDLGFIPDENMIQVNKQTIRKQVKILVSEGWSGKLETIAQNGYNLIHERHTNEIRAKELKNELERNL
jgi:hypothetical protein